MTREQIEAELKTFPSANLHPLTPDMTILFAHHIAKLEREALIAEVDRLGLHDTYVNFKDIRIILGKCRIKDIRIILDKWRTK